MLMIMRHALWKHHEAFAVKWTCKRRFKCYFICDNTALMAYLHLLMTLFTQRVTLRSWVSITMSHYCWFFSTVILLQSLFAWSCAECWQHLSGLQQNDARAERCQWLHYFHSVNVRTDSSSSSRDSRTPDGTISMLWPCHNAMPSSLKKLCIISVSNSFFCQTTELMKVICKWCWVKEFPTVIIL